jgi:hypothetical protein
MVTNAGSKVLMRTYFSSHHLFGARHFARLTRDAESAHTGAPIFDVQHRAYVTNAVLSAVAFLDAAINEVFDDVADHHPGYVDPLPDECKRLMAGLWDKGMERRSFLDKCQVALLCANSAVFDKGGPPYQDADLLYRLRNRLTHARAETRSTDDEQDDAPKKTDKPKRPRRIKTNSARHPKLAVTAVLGSDDFADRLDRAIERAQGPSKVIETRLRRSRSRPQALSQRRLVRPSPDADADPLRYSITSLASVRRSRKCRLSLARRRPDLGPIQC